MPSWNSPARGAQLADKEALGQGLRTAIVAFGGFAAGYWGVGSLDVAVYATFGGLALTGIADFGGTLPDRFFANIGGALTGAILVTIGTWASAGSVSIGAIATLLVGAAVVFAGLFGGYVAAGANAVILYYLVALGTPAHLDALPSRLAGVALAGALAATASVALWPERGGNQVVQLLASEADLISTRLSALATDPTAGLPEERGSSLRSRVNAATSRPDTPTAKGRALLYLLNDLERLDHLTIAVARVSDERSRASLRDASRSLTWVASSLRGTSAPSRPIETDTTSMEVDLVSRISYTANLAINHSTVAMGRSLRGGSDTLDTRPTVLLRHALRRGISHLRLDSVQLRNAIRTGAALGIAYLVARWTKVQHGFWVELATLTVVSSTARVTGRRVASAIAGTAVGVVLAILLIEGSGPNVTFYAWFTPIAIAAAIWARAAIGFGAGQAGFTIAVLVLFSLLKPAGWHIGLLRFEDVSIGVAVALAVSAVAWPGGARRVLARDLHDLRRVAASYLRSVVENAALGLPLESDLTRRRNLAMASALRTEAAFAQRLSERPPGQEVSSWADRVSAANRLWYSADLIRSVKGSIVVSDEAIAAAARLEATVRASSWPNTEGRVRPSNGRDPVVTPPDPLSTWIEDLANSNRPQTDGSVYRKPRFTCATRRRADKTNLWQSDRRSNQYGWMDADGRVELKSQFRASRTDDRDSPATPMPRKRVRMWVLDRDSISTAATDT